MLTQLGRPEDGTDADAAQQPRDLRQAEAARRSGATSIHTLDDIDRRAWTSDLQRDPRHRVQLQPADPRQRQREHLRPVRARSRVKIYGDDLDKLQRARRARPRTSIAKVPGVRRPRASSRRRGAADRGQRPTATRSPATTSTSATCRTTSRPRWRATRLASSGRARSRFDVTVRLPLASREDVEAIRDLRVPLKDGALVPLSALADVKMAHGPRRDHPRERPPLRRHPHERAQPRPRLVRRRGAAQGRRGRCTLPAGYDHGVGRRVREQAARDGAPRRWWCRWRC